MNDHDIDLPTVTVEQKTTVARWADRRGKNWIELTEERVNGRQSYGYTTSWGAKGSFGPVMMRQALARIEDDRSLCSIHLEQVPVVYDLKQAA